MPRQTHLEQRTPEWHEFRKDKIGASMAPVIMGVSPYRSPLMLYQELAEGRVFETTPAMQRGIALETEALEWFNQTMPKKYPPYEPTVFQHQKYDWMIASLDGWNGSHLVEIKCSNKEEHLKTFHGEIPEKYYPQLQHQMFVTDTRKCFYCSYNGSSGNVIAVDRDDEYCQELVAKERAFLDSVIKKEPPEPINMDIQEIDDPRALLLVKDYKELVEQISLMENLKEEIRKELISYAKGDKNRIGPLLMTRSIHKGRIEYSRIPELVGVELDQYRKPEIEIWHLKNSP